MGLVNMLNAFRYLMVSCMCFRYALLDADFGRCGDPDCSEPLAYGHTNGFSPQMKENMLTVKSGQRVEIFVKEYGERKELLGVEVNGKRGYIPKSIVTEDRRVKNADFVAKKEFLDLKVGSEKKSGASGDSVVSLPSIAKEAPSQASNTDFITSSEYQRSTDTEGHHSDSHIHISGGEESMELEVNLSDMESTVPPTSFSSSVDMNTHASMPSAPVSTSYTPTDSYIQASSTTLPSMQVESESKANAKSLEDASELYYTKTTKQVEKAVKSIEQHFLSQLTVKSSQSYTSEMLATTPTPTEVSDEGEYDETLKLLQQMCSEGGACPEDILNSFSSEKSPVISEASTVASAMNSGGSDFNASPGLQASESLNTDREIYSDTKSDVHGTVDNMKFSQTDLPSLVNSSNPSEGNIGDAIGSEDPFEDDKGQVSGVSPAADDETEFHESKSADKDVESQEQSTAEHSGDKVGSGQPSAEQGVSELPLEGSHIHDTGSVNGMLASETLDTKANLEHMSTPDLFTGKASQSSVSHDFGFGHSDSVAENSKLDIAKKVDEILRNEISDVSFSEELHERQSEPVIYSPYVESSKTPEQSHLSSVEHSSYTDSDLPVASGFSTAETVAEDSITPHPSDTSFVSSSDDINVPKTDSSKDSTLLNEMPKSSNESPGFSEQHQGFGIQHRHILGEENEQGRTSTENDIRESTESYDGNLGDETASDITEAESSWEEMLESFVQSICEVFANAVYALRAFLDCVISWAPEPVHSYLEDLNVSGISARAVTFTAISAFPVAALFFAVIYLQRTSRESDFIAKLRDVEQKLYQTSTERNALLNDNISLKEHVESIEKNFAEDRSLSDTLKANINSLEIECETLQTEKMSQEKMILSLSQENGDLKTKLAAANDEIKQLTEHLQEEKSAMLVASESNSKLQEEVEQMKSEIQQFLASEEKYKGKISSLEQSCSQLLQEAEIWNTRVNELTEQLYGEATARKEAEKLIESKDMEIETMKTTLENMDVIQNLKDSGEADNKTLEDSMKSLLDVSKVQTELKKSEEMNESLSDKLKQERNKVLEMEVELLESKSEVEKLRSNYNQALQDKAEAQTKLDVLTKYFKDKELQLQKELGAQEAVRQRKEEDFSQAERRRHLMEEENASYKYQVATLKQEIEETERNLKSQIAAQEKKAHENWLAARAAERKMEEMKQENSQLRQRLTLLEREQEKWTSSSQGDVIRPVPQRISDSVHDVSSSNDGSLSLEFMPRHIPPPPPSMHPDDLPPTLRPLPMMPPPHGRPPLLPPPPSHSPRPMPPPLLPPYMPPPPPFDPTLPPPPRPQPWGLLHEKRMDSDRRNISSEFESPSSRGRRTPPHSDRGRRSASPGEVNSRSRGSSPPEALPDFHNIPPAVGRHQDLPPPGQHARFPGGPPPPPPHMMQRRDFSHGVAPYRTGRRTEVDPDESSAESRTRMSARLRQHPSEEEV